MTKVVFERMETDPQDGTTTWEIRLETGGVTEVVGSIHKDTVWCGDGYRADTYHVEVDRDQWDDSREKTFQVCNIWSRGRGTSARTAMAEAKAWAREQLKEGL